MLSSVENSSRILSFGFGPIGTPIKVVRETLFPSPANLVPLHILVSRFPRL
jgi:hypothetical protein